MRKKANVVRSISALLVLTGCSASNGDDTTQSAVAENYKTAVQCAAFFQDVMRGMQQTGRTPPNIYLDGRELHTGKAFAFGSVMSKPQGTVSAEIRASEDASDVKAAAFDFLNSADNAHAALAASKICGDDAFVN